MDKIKLNYLVDLGLLISFLTCFITGIFKFPGMTKIFGTSIYVMVPNISVLHDWGGLIMGIFVLIHLVLHWNWIVCITKSFVRGKGEEKCKNI